MIYLIKAYGKEGVLLKIGFTDNLNSRLESYVTHTPDYELLKTREGDLILEKYLLNYFKDFNYRGEWFRFDQKIVDEFDIVQLDRTVFIEKQQKRFSPDWSKDLEKEFMTNHKIDISKNTEMRRIYLAYRYKHLLIDKSEISNYVNSFLDYFRLISKNVMKFYSDFWENKSFIGRLKFLCENNNLLTPEELNEFFSLFRKDNYENFYFGLGPERCKALGYNYSALLKDYELKFFDTAPVRERILSEFKVGDRLITSEVKEILRMIYQDLKYNKTPKATDLEEYFELKDTRIKNSNGKMSRGFEILAQK